MEVLGIDIGGSGIKGALVDVGTGRMVTERFRISTPDGAKPEDVAKTVKELIDHFAWQGPVGVGFPAVVRQGVAESAANISKEWIGTNVNELLSKACGCPVFTLNDADAAGIAEMTFGAGKDSKKGVVMILTLGTGIGSAIFVDGVLLPNTELGHLQMKGKDAETRTSDAARKNLDLSWKHWVKRLQKYFDYLERLFSPDLFIIGGGVSKDSEKFLPLLKTRARLVPATMLNQAGIIGSAMYASTQTKRKK
ncbi:MAG TPA: ROK family protein [Longilinea sp.]|nr:ROK family protein [Longilinea sp.]